jgi:hypothetical protein
MRKRYKILLFALGVLLMFLFNLQIVIPATYLSVGFIFYLFFFCWAKAKNLDERYDGWDYVLNSVRGMSYFLISGSILWAPVLIPFVVELKDKLKGEKRLAWMQYIKNPMQIHRDWFNNFYQ